MYMVAGQTTRNFLTASFPDDGRANREFWTKDRDGEIPALAAILSVLKASIR